MNVPQQGLLGTFLFFISRLLVPQIWGKEKDVFLPRSHGALKKEAKRRPSNVDCRVPRVWGQEKDVFLPRSHGPLNAWKENKQHPSDFACRTLNSGYTGVLTRGRIRNTIL